MSVIEVGQIRPVYKGTWESGAYNAYDWVTKSGVPWIALTDTGNEPLAPDWVVFGSDMQAIQRAKDVFVAAGQTVFPLTNCKILADYPESFTLLTNGIVQMGAFACDSNGDPTGEDAMFVNAGGEIGSLAQSVLVWVTTAIDPFAGDQIVLSGDEQVARVELTGSTQVGVIDVATTEGVALINEGLGATTALLEDATAQVAIAIETKDTIELIAPAVVVVGEQQTETVVSEGNTQVARLVAIGDEIVVGEHNHDERYYTESEVDLLLANLGGATPSYFGSLSITELMYTVDDAIGKITYSTGETATYAYDTNNSLETIVWKSVADVTLATVTYTYNVDGSLATAIRS